MIFAGYLISIVAVCIASVVVELVLPSSSVANFCKKVVALVVVFVIVSPIPKLIAKSKVNLPLSNQIDLIDNNFLDVLKNQKKQNLEKLIEGTLNSQSFECDVDVVLDYFADDFKVNLVSVYIISGQSDADIKSCIKQYLKIEDDKIIIL